jgi:hypothetical protein
MRNLFYALGVLQMLPSFSEKPHADGPRHSCCYRFSRLRSAGGYGVAIESHVARRCSAIEW